MSEQLETRVCELEERVEKMDEQIGRLTDILIEFADVLTKAGRGVCKSEPKLKGKEGERGWADNTGLDDKCRWFTKDGKSVDCHCKLIPFGMSFVMDYKPECEVHGAVKGEI